MKYFIFNLLALIFISCNSDTTSTVAINNVTPVEHTEGKNKSVEMIKPLEGDPTFVEPKEMITPYGPDNITRQIIQDRNGNMWMASWCGIIKYDSKNFTNYTLKDNLERFHVLSVYEDKKGQLWFGTVGGGLYCYNGSTFKRFTIKDGLASNLVYCVTEDNNGLIWIGTNAGLSIYDGNSFRNINTSDGLDHNVINTIIQDNQGVIWFGTRGALCYYTPSTLANNMPVKILKKEGPFADVRIMYKDKKGLIWLGTVQNGVYCYNYKLQDGIGNGKAFTLFTKKEGLSDNFITTISEDSKGNMWFGGDICYFDGKSFTPIKIKDMQNSANVFCVYGDKNGNIWIANSTGVLRYDGKNFEDFKQK